MIFLKMFLIQPICYFDNSISIGWLFRSFALEAITKTMDPNTYFTALIKETDDGWFFGQIEEVPEAMSQGKTIDELQANLRDALSLILELRREETIQRYHGESYITRQIVLG